MDQISKFLTCYIPVHACNFRCQYCYLSHHVDEDVYGGGIKPLAVNPSEFIKFFSVERLGGLAYFNLCAPGETMLHPELVELVYCITKSGHYADIVTNGTLSKKFDELIVKLDDSCRKHLFIKFSFHYLELLKKGKMRDFLDNVEKTRKSGISYSIEITPHDELVPYIDEIKQFSMEHFGALPHVTVARDEGTKTIALLTKYSREEYKKIWSVFDSELFNFKISLFNKKRNEFCYAGLWSLAVDLESGVYRQCYGGDVLGKIFNVDKPIKFRAICECRQPHCFNGHAFLAGGGDIPELDGPIYAEERDRITLDGEHWFQEDIRMFFSSKLKNSNKQYSEKKKRFIRFKNKILHYGNVGENGIKKVFGMIFNGNSK